jgi:hypothetical protein
MTRYLSLTRTGVAEKLTLPVPSCLHALEPQQYATPFATIPQTWDPPALIC